MADELDVIYRIGGCAAVLAADAPGGFRGRFLEGPAQGREVVSRSMAAVIAALHHALRDTGVQPAPPVH